MIALLSCDPNSCRDRLSDPTDGQSVAPRVCEKEQPGWLQSRLSWNPRPSKSRHLSNCLGAVPTKQVVWQLGVAEARAERVEVGGSGSLEAAIYDDLLN